MSNRRLVVAVSVEDGGIRIQAAEATPVPGVWEELEVEREFEERDSEEEEIAPAAVVETIKSFWAKHRIGGDARALSVSVFGAVSRQGVLTAVPRRSAVEEHYFSFRDELRGLIAPWKVTVENDITAAALGEHWHGAGRKHDTFGYVHIGRGVNCGLILRSDIWRSALHPEAGHMRPVPYRGRGVGPEHWSQTLKGTCVHTDPPCYESLLSLHARMELARRRVGMENRVDFWAYHAAQLVNAVNLMLAPPRIIIGGSAFTATSKAPIPADMFLTRLQERFEELHGTFPMHEHSGHPERFLMMGSLGDKASAYGALELARRKAFELEDSGNGSTKIQAS